MEHIQVTEDSIRRYLLGLPDQEEQRRIEEKLMTDAEYFEELQVAEDELIDDYIRGALSEREREAFEHYFLATPERDRKLSFAKALNEYVMVADITELPSEIGGNQRPAFWNRLILPALRAQNPMLKLSLAALLIIIVGLSWQVLKSARLQNPAGIESQSTVITVTLSPGAVRDTGEIKRVDVADNVSTVHLQLELATDEYQNYHVVIQTGEGSQVFSAGKLEPETMSMKRAVIVDVPARLLTKGDFQIKLSGLAAGGQLESVGKYYFRIVSAARQS